jgi:hypothetical protein
MRYLILAGLLSACGHTYQYSVPADIEPLVQKFRDESAARSFSLNTSDLVIEVVDTLDSSEGETSSAICLSQFNTTPKIELLDIIWNKASPTFKEVVLFHELGHCLLNRAHVNGFDNEGNPLSIMWPWTVNPDTYTAHEQSYLDELFDPTKLGGL